jgi:hypothetical protein
MVDQQTIIDQENAQHAQFAKKLKANRARQQEKKKKNRRLIFYILRIIFTGGIDWIAIKGLAKDHKILTIIVISFAILFLFAVLQAIILGISYYACSSFWSASMIKLSSWFSDTYNICQHF